MYCTTTQRTLDWRGSQQEVGVGVTSEYALKAFKMLKQACMTTSVLAFADYAKPFLLETDANKERLWAVLSQKQADGQYHPVVYSSRAELMRKPIV